VSQIPISKKIDQKIPYKNFKQKIIFLSAVCVGGQASGKKQVKKLCDSQNILNEITNRNPLKIQV
jgi:hypothetical protein